MGVGAVVVIYDDLCGGRGMVTSLDAPIYVGGVYSVNPLELHQHRFFKNIRNLETAKYRPHPKTISQLQKTEALI